MKRPEKKKDILTIDFAIDRPSFAEGWNECCDDWEAYLNEVCDNELGSIVKNNPYAHDEFSNLGPICQWDVYSEKLAKAISKRFKGEI